MLRRFLMVATLCWLASALALAQSATTSAPVGTTTAVVKAAPAKAATAPSEADDVSGDEGTKKQQAESKARVLSLLQRSYGLNEQLSLREKLSALSRQAGVAARFKPELGRAWADELFETANEADKPLDRVTAQTSAVRALTHSDPEHALELLGRIEPMDLSSQPFAVDPIDLASRELFTALFTKQGLQIIPKIRAQARSLGERGTYPYAGIAVLVNQIARKDKDSESAQSLFGEMTVFYEQNGSTPASDTRFANTLFSTAGLLPRSSVQQALELLVKNVLSRQYDSQQHVTASYTSASGSAQLTDPADVVLARLAGLIRQYDPDMATKLAKDRPQLGVLLTDGRTGGVRISVTNAPAGSRAPAQSAMATRIDMQRTLQQFQSMAGSDPQKAMAMALNLPDDSVRARVLSLLVSFISVQGSDPQRANTIFDRADQLAERSHDVRAELEIAAGRAEAAHRAEDSAQLNIALQRGFGLGNELLRKEQDEHPGTSGISVYFLGRLVRAGMTSNPDLVMGYIDTIAWPYFKATLLVDAAEALLNERLVVGGALAPDRAPAR